MNKFYNKIINKIIKYVHINGILLISLSIFPTRLYTRPNTRARCFMFESCHGQLLNQAPCQGNLSIFQRTKKGAIIKACHGKFVKEKLLKLTL